MGTFVQWVMVFKRANQGMLEEEQKMNESDIW